MKVWAMRLISVLGAVGVLTALSLPANSSILDFTDPLFTGTLTDVNGDGTVWTGTTSGGIGFSLSSDSGISFNESYDGTGAIGSGGCDTSVLACTDDGAGVGSDDELTSGPYVTNEDPITLTFDQDVYLKTAYLLDLYEGDVYDEKATITLNGTTLEVDGDSVSGTGGYATADLGGVLTGSIVFAALDYGTFRYVFGYDDWTNDYALAGIKISAVPIPAAFLLFATALAGAGSFGWRRKRFTASA